MRNYSFEVEIALNTGEKPKSTAYSGDLPPFLIVVKQSMPYYQRVIIVNDEEFQAQDNKFRD